MIIAYKERRFLDRYSCVDTIKQARVLEKSFTSGGMTYFKKDNFNYFVVDTDFIIDILEG